MKNCYHRDRIYGGAGNDRLDGEGRNNDPNGGDGTDSGHTRNGKLVVGLLSIEAIL